MHQSDRHTTPSGEVPSSCGGCKSSAPCKQCGSTAGPHDDELNWFLHGPGVRRNEPAWMRLTRAYDAVASSRRVRDSGQQPALRRFVREASRLVREAEAVVGAVTDPHWTALDGNQRPLDGLGSRGSAYGMHLYDIEYEWRDPGDPPYELPIDGPPSGYTPTSPSLIDGKTCCILKFVYPIAPVRRIKEPTADTNSQGVPSGVKIKTAFGAFALFDKNGICACECCEFRQYVIRYAGLLVEANGPGWALGVESGHEDCVWITTGADGGERRRFPGSPNNPPDLEAGETKLWGPYCPGQRHRPESPPGVTVEPNYTYDALCGFVVADSPGFRQPVPNGVKFALSYAFVGVIHDTCRDWMVVDAKVLEFGVWSGKVSSGQVVDEKLR